MSVFVNPRTDVARSDENFSDKHWKTRGSPSNPRGGKIARPGCHIHQPRAIFPPLGLRARGPQSHHPETSDRGKRTRARKGKKNTPPGGMTSMSRLATKKPPDSIYNSKDNPRISIPNGADRGSLTKTSYRPRSCVKKLTHGRYFAVRGPWSVNFLRNNLEITASHTPKLS